MIRFVFWLVLKRLWSERWLAAALLAGMLVAVTLISSVTLYAEGAMERLLAERWDTGRGQAGAVLVVHSEDLTRATGYAEYQSVSRFMEAAPARTGLPAQHVSTGGTLATAALIPKGQDRTMERFGAVAYRSNLFAHVTVADGRLPQGAVSPEHVVEAVVDTHTLHQLDLTVGRTYRYPAGRTPTAPVLQVRIVGAFKPAEKLTPYWPYRPPFAGLLFVTPEAWEALLQSEQYRVDEFDWYWLADHRQIRAARADAIIRDLRWLESRLAQLMPDTRLAVSPLQVLTGFALLGRDLRLHLLLLAAPIAGLVLYFTVMASGMIAAQGAAEIAVIRSRGGSVAQVVLIYLLQSLVLAAIALAAGVPLGMLGAKLIGAAGGFLQFVARRPLPVALSLRSWLYPAAVLLGAVLAGLVPVAGAARQSIVSYKAQRARRTRPPLHQRFLLDLVLLGFALWSYRFLSARQGPLEQAADAVIAPSLYFAPVLFILAVTLVGLRLFPLGARACAWLAARGRGVALHAVLTRFARSPGEYTAILTLLVMTVAMGIYSGAAAATIDRNFLDWERYKTGADLVVSILWTSPARGPSDQPARLTERPRSLFENLPGVREGARVYTVTSPLSVGGKGLGDTRVMMIDPAHFSGVAFFRHDFAPYHINAYMNNLLRYREGAVISREVAAQGGLQLGDRISLQVRGQVVSLRVVGIVDYWPTFYPPEERFAVLNLDYIEETVGLVPYDWWFAMEPGARVRPVVEELRERGVMVTRVVDTRSGINARRQEPQRTGLYGQLSLGFLAAVLVTVLGYLLYTLVSLRARLVEIGVLRAMGLSVRQLVAMLAAEQVFILGSGLTGGTLLGLWSAGLFLPFLQATADAAGRTPRFVVVSRWADIAKVIGVLGITLVIALVVITVFVRQIRLAQAVKLGEEN